MNRQAPPPPEPGPNALAGWVICDDACPARARFRVHVAFGKVLDFCGHHFRKHALTFMARGYGWSDLNEAPDVARTEWKGTFG